MTSATVSMANAYPSSSPDSEDTSSQPILMTDIDPSAFLRPITPAELSNMITCCRCGANTAAALERCTTCGGLWDTTTDAGAPVGGLGRRAVAFLVDLLIFYATGTAIVGLLPVVIE